MKKSYVIGAVLTLATASCSAMLQHIKRNNREHARGEDVIPKFFVQKNLFMALCLKASRNKTDSLFDELIMRIKNREIDTSGEYVFMTTADAHKRLLAHIPVKKCKKNGEKEEKVLAQPHYTTTINNIPIHLTILETMQLPKGYEYMQQVMKQKEAEKDSQEKPLPPIIETDYELDPNGYVLTPPTPSTEWDNFELTPYLVFPKMMSSASIKNTDIPPVPVTSEILKQRHPDLGYEIHSHDFAKKIPAKDIVKKFEALVQIDSLQKI